MKYNLNQACEILQQTPRTLKSFLEHLSDKWIFCDEGNNTWSAFDIVGHLIHGEKTDWIIRLNVILDSSENKMFKPFDRFAQFQLSKEKTLIEMLNEFETLRNKNINTLKALHLTENQLNLKGIHPELGEVTLSQLLATWVVHDLGHIAQISRVMSKQYITEVGPWAEYLPVLKK